MALTKHQRLARAIKQTLDRLDAFYVKVAQFLDVLQFHFYEKTLVLGRPKMKERGLKAMTVTHKRGLRVLAPDLQFRTLCASKPVLGAVISPPLPFSPVVTSAPENPPDARWVTPWAVKVVLPQDISQQLHTVYHEAILYCAGEHEMANWIDWFEKEDQASSLMQQFFSIQTYFRTHQEEDNVLKKNLRQPAFPHFKQIAMNREGSLSPSLQKREPNSWFPKKDSTVAEAYQAITQAPKSRNERYHDQLKADWKARLEELIFEELNWSRDAQQAYIKGWAAPQVHIGNKSGIRWQTSLAIDRATYSSFIMHFAKRFLEDPLGRPMDGEIILLLWLMICIAEGQTSKPSLRLLLDMTTKQLADRTVCIDGQEIEISTGLSQVLQAYIGILPAHRHRKLFPNLSIDNLEDCFREASQELLPAGSSPALPEAFLTFPHNLGCVRILPAIRRQMQASPPQIHNENTSWRAITRQLRTDSH